MNITTLILCIQPKIIHLVDHEFHSIIQQLRFQSIGWFAFQAWSTFMQFHRLNSSTQVLNQNQNQFQCY